MDMMDGRLLLPLLDLHSQKLMVQHITVVLSVSAFVTEGINRVRAVNMPSAMSAGRWLLP